MRKLAPCHHRAPGFSLIELMIVVALAAMMLVIAVRALPGWAADVRVRSAAEQMLSDLRQTQSSAVANNRVAEFTLTNDAPPVYSSTPSSSGANWVSRLLPLLADETPATLNILQQSTVGSQYGVNVSGNPLMPLCFNSMGQLAAVKASAANGLGSDCQLPSGTAPVTIVVSSPAAVRKFEVLVYPGGQTRMCDALKTFSPTTSPDGCPA